MSPRTSLPMGHCCCVWSVWYAQIRVGIKPILTVMLLQPLILMCWSRFHGHGPRARSPGIMISLSRAAQWETTPEPGTEPCYGGGEQCAVSGTVMLGGNLGNWIKTEHDLYIWEFYVIITGSYKCTMSAICMQSTTGSTVTQFICSQNCEIDANIALGWLRMSGIPGLLCYQCWFLSLLLSALSSSVAATNH